MRRDEIVVLIEACDLGVDGELVKQIVFAEIVEFDGRLRSMKLLSMMRLVRQMRPRRFPRLVSIFIVWGM